jgi:FKBP-type peptidyl-prolyl cis-trans isomerase SlyD
MSNESEADEAETEAQTAEDVDETEAQTAEDVDETEAEETGDEETGFQRGDFVTIAYTARTVEDGTLVDTTDPEVAEEEGVGEDQEFAPRTVVLGEGHVFGAVEDDIVGNEVGDEGTVTVGAAEAFGEFDQDEVRTVSVDRIPEDDRYPGAHVDIDGEHGHVETVIGGRARVDFNHPLAGEDVEYEYEILDEVEDREEKAQALLDTMLDIDLEMWFETDVEEEEQIVEPDEREEEAEDGDEKEEEAEPEYETVEVEKETLYIEATPQLTMNQQWMMGKQQIAQQLVDQLGVDRVIVQETLGEGMGMGMGGMMGGMGGMGGGDIEEALEDEDIDADELVEELEGAGE